MSETRGRPIAAELLEATPVTAPCGCRFELFEDGATWAYPCRGHDTGLWARASRGGFKAGLAGIMHAVVVGILVGVGIHAPLLAVLIR